MITYHGSDIQGLTKLLSEYSSEDNFEGKAIYLSLSKNHARQYVVGKGSLYTVKVDDSAKILSLLTDDDVYKLLDSTLKEFGIDIFNCEYKSQYPHFVLNHSGKNGLWCLADDVVDLLKYEPEYKKILTKEISHGIKTHLTNTINSYDGYILNLPHEKSTMVVIKNDQVCSIIDEQKIND